MRILIVSTPSKLRRTKRLWDELGRRTEVKHEILEQGGFADLADLADRCDFAGFDRIIVDHNLRRMGTEYKQLRRIPKLALLDFDFCQNYLPGSECKGKLESVLKTLGQHRLITSSLCIRDDLRVKGFDAAYSPKAYDVSVVQPLDLPRDIEFGFIGRSKHWAYQMRRDMLDRLRKDIGLQVLRTEENDEYSRTLNRIRIFVNPDLGYNEIMIKSFEAMAAGCVLLAPQPPPEELAYLGWVDLENVVLYGTYEELLAKVKRFKDDAAKLQQVAKAGQQLAATRHRWEDRAAGILDLLRPPLQPPPALNLKDRWNLLTL